MWISQIRTWCRPFRPRTEAHTVSAKYGTFKTCECYRVFGLWRPLATPGSRTRMSLPPLVSLRTSMRIRRRPLTGVTLTFAKTCQSWALSWCCLRKKGCRLSAEWILPLISMTSRQETLPPWGRAPMHSVGLWALSADACQRSVGLWTFESTAARQQEPRLCRHAPQHFHWHFVLPLHHCSFKLSEVFEINSSHVWLPGTHGLSCVRKRGIDAPKALP